MRIRVRVPGSCGELIQGTLDGVPFLVTCPVNIYTEVTLTSASAPKYIGLGSKSQRALSHTLEYLGAESFHYKAELTSELPIGKGMASSSADIAAVMIAAAASFGVTLTAAEVSRLAAGIEPTDGVFFPGIVRMNQMTGECFESYGELARLKIAAFDCGGSVDTLSFHERDDLDDLNRENEELVKKALETFASGANEENIAEAATISALANQKIIFKRDLEKIIDEAKALGALGVNVAHSGTVIGVLFSANASGQTLAEAERILPRKFAHLRFLRQTELIGGGAAVSIES